MTKKKVSKAKKEEPQEKQQQYVILRRISYKSQILAERETIDPAPDPYAPDAPRRPFEHLSQADINKLVMRKCIALDKQE